MNKQLVITIFVFFLLIGCASNKAVLINPVEEHYQYKANLSYAFIQIEHGEDNQYKDSRICLVVETDLKRKGKKIPYTIIGFNNNKRIFYNNIDGKGETILLLDKLIPDKNQCNLTIRFMIKNDYFDVDYTTSYKGIFDYSIKIINEKDDEDIQIELIQQVLSINFFNEKDKKEIMNLSETLLKKRINKYKNNKDNIKYINSLITYRLLINKKVYALLKNFPRKPDLEKKENIDEEIIKAMSKIKNLDYNAFVNSLFYTAIDRRNEEFLLDSDDWPAQKSFIGIGNLYTGKIIQVIEQGKFLVLINYEDEYSDHELNYLEIPPILMNDNNKLIVDNTEIKALVTPSGIYSYINAQGSKNTVKKFTAYYIKN